MLILCSCSNLRYIPIVDKENTVTHYIDSVRYIQKDSIVLIPKDVIKDYTWMLDTLYMENSISKAIAYVDTTHQILNGSLESKVQLIYKDRVVYKDKIVEKTDTVKVYEQVPYPVIEEKTHYPKSYWYLLAFAILSVLGIIMYLYSKFKNFRLPWI